MKQEQQDVDKVGELYYFLGFCVCLHSSTIESLKWNQCERNWEETFFAILHGAPWETLPGEVCLQSPGLNPGVARSRMPKGILNCSTGASSWGGPEGPWCQGTRTSQTAPCPLPTHRIDQSVDCEPSLENRQNLRQFPERDSLMYPRLQTLSSWGNKDLSPEVGSGHPSYSPFLHP